MSADSDGHGTSRCASSTAPPNGSPETLALHRYPPLSATDTHVAHHQNQTHHEGTRTMLDRTQVDATIYRVAIAAFTYYPDKHTTEPGYTVDEDLEWCMRPLRHLPKEERDELRARILELIADPSADRQAFIGYLKSLAADN